MYMYGDAVTYKGYIKVDFLSQKDHPKNINCGKKATRGSWPLY